MKFEILIKYLTWIVFFAIALAGIYLMLKKAGVM